MSKEAEQERNARKSRSEAILRKAGVRVIDHLPAIETADQISLRDVTEVARRALCLLLVAARGSGLDDETVFALISQHGVGDFFTTDERLFLETQSPTEKASAQFSWRSESCWTLLWHLGFVDDLGLPVEQIEPDKAIEIVENNRLEGLIANASPRSVGEVLDEADLIYRCHRAVRHSDLTGGHEEILDSGVVYERHYALNWLIGYEGQQWDDISTDT